MALDLPLPKAILTHAHWTLGKEKMSKSTGNVVNPFFAMDRFGVDVMRYYLAREGSFKDDASYDNLHIIRRYNHDLKGQLGNLASRIIRGKKWSIRDAVKAAETEDWVELRLVDSKSVHNGQWKMLEDREGDVRKLMADYDVHAALNSIIDTIYQVRKISELCTSSTSTDKLYRRTFTLHIKRHGTWQRLSTRLHTKTSTSSSSWLPKAFGSLAFFCNPSCQRKQRYY